MSRDELRGRAWASGCRCFIQASINTSSHWQQRPASPLYPFILVAFDHGAFSPSKGTMDTRPSGIWWLFLWSLFCNGTNTLPPPWMNIKALKLRGYLQTFSFYFLWTLCLFGSFSRSKTPTKHEQRQISNFIGPGTKLLQNATNQTMSIALVLFIG